MKPRAIKKVLVFIFCFSLFYIPHFFNSNEIGFDNIKDINLGATILSPFIIDELNQGDYTWEEAETQPWCTGSGVWSDPYIIDNLDIDASGIQTNCIEIKNSRVYFEITNCILYAPVYDSAGIKLSNTSLGMLKYNDCYESYHKIRLVNSFNNTIFQNDVNHHPSGFSGNGIRLENSNNNLIDDNMVRNNRDDGIYLLRSHNNTIIDNAVQYNDGSGIYLRESINNSIIHNILDSTDYGAGLLGSGIYIERSDHNRIIDNLEYTSDHSGLEIINSKFTFVTQNYFGQGIKLRGNLTETNSHYIDPSNRAYTNEYIYYYVNRTGLSASDFSNPGQIILVNCNSSSISQISFIHPCVEPISLHYSKDILIYNTNNSWMYQSHCTEITIQHCDIKSKGISFIDCKKILVQYCSINNGGNGISFSNCQNSTVNRNIIEYNSGGGVILNENSNNIKIVYNKIQFNNIPIKYTRFGVHINDNCSKNIISHNLILNNGLGAIGMVGEGCVNNTIYNNTLSNNVRYGMYLININQNNISGNNIYATAAGEQWYGIYLYGSNEVTIKSNNIFNNTEHGIMLERGSSFNVISENNITNNTQNGILFSSKTPYCSNNQISNNQIINNNLNGIYIQKGINNLFFNNIIENPLGINALDYGTGNNWNYSYIGNYWADYPFNDLDDNLIGDFPYNINGSAGALDFNPIWADSDDPPLIVIENPLNNSILGDLAPEYSIQIADLNVSHAWYTLDGGLTNISCPHFHGFVQQSIWDPLPDGLVQITFYSNDSANNLGLSQVIVEKDSTPPVITINYPETGMKFNLTTPPFNLSILEKNLDQIWYTLDNGANNYTIYNVTGYILQNTWDEQPLGSVTIIFYASDISGNIGKTSVIMIKYEPQQPSQPEPNIHGYDFIIILIIGFLSIICFVIFKKGKYTL